MNETELEKCPFCGHEVELLNIEPNYYMVCCKSETCCSATCFGEATKEEVIKSWNTRVSIVNKGTMNIKVG